MRQMNSEGISYLAAATVSVYTASISGGLTSQEKFTANSYSNADNIQWYAAIPFSWVFSSSGINGRWVPIAAAKASCGYGQLMRDFRAVTACKRVGVIERDHTGMSLSMKKAPVAKSDRCR